MKELNDRKPLINRFVFCILFFKTGMLIRLQFYEIVKNKSSEISSWWRRQETQTFDTEYQVLLNAWIHEQKIWAVALTSDGKLVLSGDYEGRVVLRSVLES